MALKSLSPDTCIVRATHARPGRTESVSPETTATRWLRYGRIILGRDDAAVRFSTGERETALIALGGGARVTAAPLADDADAAADADADADSQTSSAQLAFTQTLVQYDAVYVPRGWQVLVEPSSAGCDLAELSAPVTGEYAPAFVSYADVRQDPTLHFKTGGPGSARELNILVGKNVAAGRLLAGVTFSDPGNWTSWPPHEHAEMLEEVYLYIDMPEPAFGVQFVYNDVSNPEIATMVREGDCVVIPQGYHPNVAAPGGRIGFLWFMAAHREEIDRQFGVVNVQPGFAAKGSGLEAARK
jgi:5-deoxy-glucuronate isomerase